MNNYTLYGSELSYYTGKVRAYLDWKGLNYTEQSGSLDVFKKIILPNVGRGIIPVLKTPDDQYILCLLYTSPSPRDQRGSRMPSSA